MFWAEVQKANLGAVLLVWAERTVEHDDAVPVEFQLNGIFFRQLGSSPCSLNESLSFPCEDIQLPDPPKDKVIVHLEAPVRRKSCTGNAVSMRVKVNFCADYKRAESLQSKFKLYQSLHSVDSLLSWWCLRLRPRSDHSHPESSTRKREVSFNLFHSHILAESCEMEEKSLN